MSVSPQISSAALGRPPVDLPLRALTGWEEELVERQSTERNTARLCNEVLARCLTAPGVEPEESLRARVRALSVAERDRALVQLRCLSLGPSVRVEVRCSACGEGNQLQFSLGDLGLDFRVAHEPIVCTLSDGESAELRLPTAGDQETMLQLGLESAAERKSWLLGQVLTRYRAHTEGFDASFARGLPVAERALLERTLTAALPDFDFRMKVACVGCQAELVHPFDLAIFFLAS